MKKIRVLEKCQFLAFFLKMDDEIDALNSVYKRQYPSPPNLNSKHTKQLCSFLARHQDLNDYYQRIGEKTHLDWRTVRKWHQKIIEDPSWSPFIQKFVPRHQVISDILEDSIMTYIEKNYLEKGYQFNDRMASFIATRFATAYPMHVATVDFKASYSWVKRFKKKYNMVYRKAHAKRRPLQTEDFKKSCIEFKERIIELYELHKREGTLYLLLNCDETAWKIAFPGEFTWSIKGSKHVDFSTDWDDKKNITAIATITADDEQYRLPLYLIAKGKSIKAEGKLEELQRYFTIGHSESGWSTTKTFFQYLYWLRQECDARYANKRGFVIKETPIDLICDCYSVHIQEDVRNAAAALNINLHFIPPGATDLLQPLDRFVFGGLKSMARALWLQRYMQHPDSKQTITEAAALLVLCWNALETKIFAKAWNIYRDPNEDELDYQLRCSSFKNDREDVLDLPKDFEVIQIEHETEDKIIKHLQDESVEDDDDLNQVDEPNTLFTSLSEEEINILKRFEEEEWVRAASRSDLSPEYDKANLQPYTQFTPLFNHTCDMCSINSELQLFSLVPDIRGHLGKLHENVNAEILQNLLSSYDSEFMLQINKDDIPWFSQNIIQDLTTLGESLELGVLRFNEMSPPTYCFLLPHSESTINDTMDKLSSQFELAFSSQCICFHINHVGGTFINESFRWKNNLFVLKAAVGYEEDTHYWVHVRVGTMNRFVCISDDKIKESSFDSITSEPICVLMYWIVTSNEAPSEEERHDNDAIKENEHNEEENDDEKIKIQEFNPTEELCNIIDSIILNERGVKKENKKVMRASERMKRTTRRREEKKEYLSNYTRDILEASFRGAKESIPKVKVKFTDNFFKQTSIERQEMPHRIISEIEEFTSNLSKENMDIVIKKLENFNKFKTNFSVIHLYEKLLKVIIEEQMWAYYPLYQRKLFSMYINMFNVIKHQLHEEETRIDEKAKDIIYQESDIDTMIACEITFHIAFDLENIENIFKYELFDETQTNISASIDVYNNMESEEIGSYIEALPQHASFILTHKEKQEC